MKGAQSDEKKKKDLIPVMDHQTAQNYIVRESSWREWIQPL